MLPNELVSKLIDLQDQANSHTLEYLKLQDLPGRKTTASVHLRKANKLRSRIQELIREIATCRPEAHGN